MARVVAVQNTGFSFLCRQPLSIGLDLLVRLYVGRSFHLWKQPELLPWLEENARESLKRVEAKVRDRLPLIYFLYWNFFMFFLQDPLVAACEERRRTRYLGVPRNIHRHVVMADVKEANISLPRVGTTALSL